MNKIADFLHATLFQMSVVRWKRLLPFILPSSCTILSNPSLSSSWESCLASHNTDVESTSFVSASSLRTSRFPPGLLILQDILNTQKWMQRHRIPIGRVGAERSRPAGRRIYESHYSKGSTVNIHDGVRGDWTITTQRQFDWLNIHEQTFGDWGRVLYVIRRNPPPLDITDAVLLIWMRKLCPLHENLNLVIACFTFYRELSAQRQYESINIHQNLCNSRTRNFIDRQSGNTVEKADWNLHFKRISNKV